MKREKGETDIAFAHRWLSVVTRTARFGVRFGRDDVERLLRDAYAQRLALTQAIRNAETVLNIKDHPQESGSSGSAR